MKQLKNSELELFICWALTVIGLNVCLPRIGPIICEWNLFFGQYLFVTITVACLAAYFTYRARMHMGNTAFIPQWWTVLNTLLCTSTVSASIVPQFVESKSVIIVIELIVIGYLSTIIFWYVRTLKKK